MTLEVNEDPIKPIELTEESESKATELKNKWELVLNSPSGLDYLNQAGEFGDKLMEKYRNVISECMLHHVLSFSGKIEKDKFTFFDFPGEDSIEQFILKCYNELFSLQENDQIKQ